MLFVCKISYNAKCCEGMLKGCPHLGGGRVLASVRTKWTGEGGGLAVSGYPFQCGIWKREEGI